MPLAGGITFSDAIGVVRYQLSLGGIERTRTPRKNLDRTKIPPGLFKRMAAALCYAA